MSFDPNSNSILQDPEYMLQNAGYIKQAHDLLVQYGIVPTSGYGADSATAQEVNANPYSIAAMLKKGYSTGLGQNMNVANAHGALFSGAYQNNQLHEADTYQRGLADAGTQLQSGLNTVSGNRTNTLVDIWNRLSQKNTQVQPDTTVAPPAPATNYAASNVAEVNVNGQRILEPTSIPGGGYTPPKAGKVAAAVKKPARQGFVGIGGHDV